MPKMPSRWDVFDLVESFQLSHAVATLHELQIFAALKKPATADELAPEYELDASLLRGMLEYVAGRTDLLRKTRNQFVTTRRYSGDSQFLLDLYVGAYGNNARQLTRLLRDPAVAPGAIDRIRYARAFDSADGSTAEFLRELIRRLQLNHVLDLGCGNAALLVELAVQNTRFAGWGVEVNRAMCRVARKRIRAAGVGNRVRVLEGDCTDLASVLRKNLRASIGAVTACNVANEMFAEGHAQAIVWLRGIRKILPGRPLLIADYYGRLGSKRNRRPSRKTLLHDYVQLISGQGVPPASAAEWRSIYWRAKCGLVHIIEDKATTRFIHIVRL
jgi:SAM-dependent methyltransferase